MFASPDQNAVFPSLADSGTLPLSTQASGLGSTHSELVDPLQQLGLLASSSSATGSDPAVLIVGGNTLTTATNIGNLEGNWTNNGQVSSSDRYDYFRFNLTALSDLTMTLAGGTSGDADIYLYRDSNNNGSIDRGETLRASTNDGNQESFSINGLATGTYYALIKQYSGSTNYTVSLTTDAPGETLADARNLGTLSGNRTLRDYVGTSDLDDFYRFQLNSASNVNFSLTNLSADADLYLVQDFNFNGQVEDGEAIAWSEMANSASETISLQGLAAGNYYLWVRQYDGNTNYTLNSSAVLADPGSTIGSAAELGVLTGQQVVRDAVSRVDTQDFFSLRLSTTSNLTLDLTGLATDADLYLIQDRNNNGLIDAGETIGRSLLSGSLSERINLNGLAAGNYLVQVVYEGAFSGSNTSTNYTLTLTADAAGDSYSTARNIGILNGTRNYSDFVGMTDTTDYYRFYVTDTSNVRIDLTGLSADADLYLMRDRNGNGRFDESDILDYSDLGGTSSDSIQIDNLAAGTYFIGVEQWTGNTNYNLSLSSTAVNGFQRVQGTLGADTFNVNLGTGRTIISGNGNVDFGTGAHDILNLSNVSSTSVALNRAGLTSGGVAYDAGNGTRIFDAITLGNGNQILFEGIEEIRFSDRTINLAITPNDPLFNQQTSLHMMGLQTAWNFITGSNNVLIGIQDSGGAVNQLGYIHNDMRSQNTYSSLTGNNYSDDFSEDTYSYGTAAQGIIAAASNNGQGISGINWNSPVQTIDVLGNDFGDLSLSNATIEMINFANSQGRRLVINLSLDVVGSSVPPQLEQLVAQNQANVLFVIAAGSENSSQLSTLASLAQRYSNVVAVGAVWDRQDENGVARVPGSRISYSGTNGSNYGAGLTLMAPGEVTTLQSTQSTSGTVNFGYDTSFYGTEAAAPNVAGVASLVWSANNNLTAAQLRQVLAETAYDLSVPGYDRTTGSGLVNADAAIRRAIALSLPNSQAPVWQQSIPVV